MSSGRERSKSGNSFLCSVVCEPHRNRTMREMAHRKKRNKIFGREHVRRPVNRTSILLKQIYLGHFLEVHQILSASFSKSKGYL